MLNFIFPSVIFICLLILVVIIYRKFPQLANLDVENLPAEMVARKKKEIISKRIDAQSHHLKNKLERWFTPIVKIWGKLQLKFRVYVGKIERLWMHEQNIKRQAVAKINPPEEKEQKLQELLKEGKQYLQTNFFESAEEAFIAALKIDPKSAAAYEGLGAAYLNRGQRNEARETLEFLSQLEPNNDAVLVQLAEIAEADGRVETAIDLYQRATVINDSLSPRFCHLAELLVKVGQPLVAKEAILQAVELEPQNPKYLDLLIEIAILCQDKKMAEKGYQDLRLVNPENQKLADFFDRINKL